MLKCENCGTTEKIPMHCGQEMHLENIENEEKLVCWMGPSCGIRDLPEHCGEPMKIVI